MSRISQQAFNIKSAESASRIRLMNRPSTVVVMPLTSVQATPSSGRMPSTRERASIIESTLPPLTFRGRLRLFFVVFLGPEFVPGAPNEYILEGGLTYRKRLDLSGKRLDRFRDEAMCAFVFDAHLIFQNRSHHLKPAPNVLGQQTRISSSFERHYVAADFALQFCRRS